MKYSERRKVLNSLIEQDCSVVLFVVEDIESAQFRYRCRNVLEVTEGGKWNVVWFLKSELGRLGDILDEVKLVVIERQTDKDGEIGVLIKKMHEVGINVVFDLDDLVFDYKDLRLLMRSTNSRNVLYWVGYIWGIRRIAKKVDGFICTNGFLAKKLERSFGKSVKIVPNSLNQEQVEVSEKCVANRRKKHKGFVVGYFSGSPTHVKDFALAEPALLKFLEAHDDVRLRVVGYMRFSDKMKKWIDAGRVEVLGLVDYLRLQELVAEVDVNIAPLVVNDFTNCKSELKFFEAAIVETATIASPTYTFKKAIKDGENGFLAKPSEWYDKLEYLYQHPEKNRKIALAAKKYALKHYYGKEFLEEVEAAYGYFIV